MKRLKKILKWTGIVLGALVAIGLVANAWFVWSTDRRLERPLAAIRAAGEPLTLADLARKPIPSKQNAATYLRQAEPDVEAIDAAIWVGDWWRNWEEGHPLPAEGARLVKAALQAHPKVVPVLEKAAACREWYGKRLDSTVPPEELQGRVLLPAVQQYRKCARILHLRAYLLVAAGNRDEAVRTALTLMRLGRQIGRHCGLTGMLTELPLRAMASDAANTALQAGPISTDTRRALDAELARLEKTDDFRQSLLSERAYDIAAMTNLRDRSFWLVVRGRWNQQMSQYLDWMQKCLAGLDRPIDYRKAVRIIDNESADQGVAVALSVPALKAALTGAVRSQAMVRSLRVLNALQTHVPPGSDKVPKLSELGLPTETTIDPFNGEPLHVKRMANGWLVYSVGMNLQDDGGDLENYRDVGVGPPRPVAKSAGK